MCGVHSIYSVGGIPSSFQLLLPFPFISVIRAVQIFVLEFSKDGLVDLGDEFADGGSTKKPLILQGGVGFSCCQVSQRYGQF